MDDADAVQPLHHVQDTDGEVHDERLRHHLVAQRFIDVHGVLKAESQFQDTKEDKLNVAVTHAGDLQSL